jgi:hypothetical protein
MVKSKLLMSDKAQPHKEGTVTHYELDDDQVEALVSAIESSPVTSNGETSELSIRAALYLTGDKPEEREEEFIDALVQVRHEDVLEKELEVFQSIQNDFAANTEGEKTPQVLQTRHRLARIVHLMQQSLEFLQEDDAASLPPSSTIVTKYAPKSAADGTRAAPAGDDTGTPTLTSAPANSVFDSNWFRFAAFSAVAVLLLLIVVGVVHWLRKINEPAASSAVDGAGAVKLADTNDTSMAALRTGVTDGTLI